MHNHIIGSDHRGVELKNYLIKHLADKFTNITNIGSDDRTASCDYPIIAQEMANLMLSSDDGYYGILICNTGIGMSIAINRYKKLRGALLTNITLAKAAKEHNNANVLCLGTINSTIENHLAMVNTFLEATFISKYQPRIDMLANF